MKIGLNVATLGSQFDFSTLVRDVRSVGAKGVEFPVQLWQETMRDPREIDGVPVWCLSGLLHKTSVLPESLLVDSQSWTTAARKIRRKCEIAVSLNASMLALQIDALSPLTQEEAKPLFIDRARECVRTANSFGLHVVFEYLSHKVARASGNSDPFIFCESLSHARELIAEISLPPRSILLDIIHWCGDGMSVEPGSMVSEVGYVHVADHANLSPDLLNDSDRVLPFSGTLPVKDFVRSLNTAGYRGPLAIEIFPGPTPPSLASIVDAVSSLEALEPQ